MNQEQIDKIASMFEEIGKHLVAAGKEAADLAVTAVYYKSLTDMITGAGLLVVACIAIWAASLTMRWSLKQDEDEGCLTFILSGVVGVVGITTSLWSLYLMQNSLLGVLSPKSALVIKILERFGM